MYPDAGAGICTCIYLPKMAQMWVNIPDVGHMEHMHWGCPLPCLFPRLQGKSWRRYADLPDVFGYAVTQNTVMYWTIECCGYRYHLLVSVKPKCLSLFLAFDGMQTHYMKPLALRLIADKKKHAFSHVSIGKQAPQIRYGTLEANRLRPIGYIDSYCYEWIDIHISTIFILWEGNHTTWRFFLNISFFFQRISTSWGPRVSAEVLEDQRFWAAHSAWSGTFSINGHTQVGNSSFKWMIFLIVHA